MTAPGVAALPPSHHSLPTKRANVGVLIEASVTVLLVNVFVIQLTEGLRVSLLAQLVRRFV